MISRVASLLVAVGYVIVAVVVAQGRDRIAVLELLGVVLPLCLAMIWFPDVLGSYIGPVGRGRHVDQESPPELIAIAGWFFLVGMPAILYFISRSRG
jgi:hypothetical protein